MDKCANCNEPLYLRSGHDIRVFHAQSPEFRKTKRGHNCKSPRLKEVNNG